MVRIKHRYLLIDILHPEPSQIHKRGPSSSSSSSIPAHLYFHPPTPDSLTSSVLARLLRETISELFGDYGIGKLGGASSGNLIGTSTYPPTSRAVLFEAFLTHECDSEIFITRYLNGNYTMSPRSI